MRIRHLALALIACAALTACSKKDETAGLPEPLTEAEKVALIASLPEPYRSADLANGASKFNGICKSCHSLARGGKNLTGPNLFGIFGRKAGTKAKFVYSEAIEHAGFTWDAEHLQGWLAGPRTFLKGTKMSFSGLKNEKDRTDLIVYLMSETGYRTPEMAKPPAP